MAWPIPFGTLLSELLAQIRGQTEQTRNAARSLTEATWEYQRGVWQFASIHMRYGVLQAARDIADEEETALRRMESASREFTKDYDWPQDLVSIFKKEIRAINIETMNLKAFSLNQQQGDIEQSAFKIQNACERIRDAARPHTLRFRRRIRELGIRKRLIDKG